MYKHIIWDWNGTLLDDVDVAVDAMNLLLENHKLPRLDIKKHKDIFAFPVRDYYGKLGLDFKKEPFEELSTEFVSHLTSGKYHYRLHRGTEEVLKSIKDMGISQSILSASEERALQEAVGTMHISEFFTRIAGISNHYAASKIERGRELLTDLGLDPNTVLLIGDTTHDYEVARELGCDCLLISNGHQSYERLKGCHANIVNTISEIKGLIYQPFL